MLAFFLLSPRTNNIHLQSTVRIQPCHTIPSTILLEQMHYLPTDIVSNSARHEFLQLPPPSTYSQMFLRLLTLPALLRFTKVFVNDSIRSVAPTCLVVVDACGMSRTDQLSPMVSFCCGCTFWCEGWHMLRFV